jgi:parvulin-like peptidyl-prolyl isomerase
MREVIGGEVGRHITVTTEEKRKYYEAHKQDFTFPEGVHLGEILISTDNRQPAEAEKRAKEALAELKSGTRWEEVAKKYSDHASAADGGDIGFIKEGTLVPALADAIAKLEDNQYTDLIQSKFGYIILKVYQHRKAGIATFEEIEPKIGDMLYSQRMEPALREYLRTLRKQSYISLASGYIDTGAERSPESPLPRKSK